MEEHDRTQLLLEMLDAIRDAARSVRKMDSLRSCDILAQMILGMVREARKVLKETQ